MKYTEEQQEIIDSDEDLKVLAYSGAGKTSSLYGYIKTRPDDCRVLYIAFNKSVQEEAEKKFEDMYHCTIHVKTAHALAFSKIVKKSKYKVGDIKIDKVVELLDVDYKLANHILGYLICYLGSDSDHIEKINYGNTLDTKSSFEYYQGYKDEIVKGAKHIFDLMDKAEIDITHDFYIKKWQLSKPRLDYDYILLDEAQDSSDVMLDVFNRQKGIKVAVGDTHQQIYAWRNAVNALGKINFKSLRLTKSFRFEQNIADLAIKTIKWKQEILFDESVSDFNIIGLGKVGEIKQTGIIGRTNIQLLSRAIVDLIINPKGYKACFEGGYKNYSSFTLTNYLKDIINIKNGNHSSVINNELSLLQFDEIPDYCDEINSISIKQAWELVDKYGDIIIDHISKLEKLLLTNKDECDVVYSTVHKSKGMEYEKVILLDDFKCKSDLKRMFIGEDKNKHNVKKQVNEEINLLYVAITRSKGYIELPDKINKDLL